MKTFDITIEMLHAKGACAAGMRDFLKEYPNGVDYQQFLNNCAEKGRDDYATWLLKSFGKTDTTLEVYELHSEKSVFFSGSIIVKGAIECKKRITAGCGIEAGKNIEAGEGIEAGYGIKAGDGIEAGGGIEAGKNIEAGDGIEAGWDCGIYAGLKVRLSGKKEDAYIKSKKEPEKIVCGKWRENND